MKKLRIMILKMPLTRTRQYYTKYLGKKQEWMYWGAIDKKGTRVALRLTVKGAAGTGKSFIINTSVSYLRRMFDDNTVVHVVAPTGMAAFSILGDTLHIFTGLNKKMKKDILCKK
jgi:hypothetical protein